MDCSEVNGLSNGVHVPTTSEDGMLATAEYIKYMGAFFNKEPLANEVYSATKVAYEQAASSASTTPVVAWISYNAYGGPGWNEPEFKVSTASYKLTLVEHAGGANFDAATKLADVTGVTVSDAVSGNPAAGKTYAFLFSSFEGSSDDEKKTAAAAALMGALADVDVVIDETYSWDPTAATFESFLSTFGLTSSSTLKFVENLMVLRFDRTVSKANGLDWYESRIARPEWAVEGLAHSLHGDTTKDPKYFRNVAKGEEVDQVMEASHCSTVLPACTTDATPSTIVLTGPVGLADDVSNAAPLALSAAAVSAAAVATAAAALAA
jgi:hypothetical protein